jgi:very-short-patch-repair endonuclease
MIGLLAVLGERYISHVDFAWPQYHRILEFYGGPHYKPELDRRGTRHEDDARRIATLESVGWHVLIVFDFEISRDAWPTVIEKVERFLRQGSIREQEDEL